MTARPSRLQRHRDDGHRGCLRQRGLAGPQFKWAGYQIVLPSRSGAEGRPAEGERLAHLPDRIGKPACERKQTLSTSNPGGCAGAAGSEGWHAPQKSISFAEATGPSFPSKPASASLSALVSVPSLFGDAGAFSPSSAPKATAGGSPGGAGRGKPAFTTGVLVGEGTSEPLGL